MRVWAPLLDSSSQAHTDTCAAAWPGGRAAFALLTQGGALQLEILFYFILFYLFIYLWLRWVFAQAFSSCGDWGLLFIVVRGLLIAVASLVAEHGL